MITFGEVLNFEGAQYVYLAATEEIIYLAKILSRSEAERINNLCARRQSDGQINRVDNSPLYCFVILSTDEFRDKMAHLGKTDHGFNLDSYMDSIGRLNKIDLRAIKKTISSGPVPIELKELVKNIVI